MTTKPRTIDNMGIETSSRYAKDQAALDTQIIRDSRIVPQKTEVSVLRPYLPSEFESYLSPMQRTLWASFTPPTGYFSSELPLFSYQIVPSLGSSEKLEADADKLEALEEFGQDDEDQQERQSKERERKILQTLLETIRKLDRTLSLINARRNQYQRG